MCPAVTTFDPKMHQRYRRHPADTLVFHLCRLDNMTGSGVHLNPQGVHVDQRVIALGKVCFSERNIIVHCTYDGYVVMCMLWGLGGLHCRARHAECLHLLLWQDTSVRFAGHAYFPRQLPAPEGKSLIDTDVERLVSLLCCFCAISSDIMCAFSRRFCSRLLHVSMRPELYAGSQDILVMNGQRQNRGELDALQPVAELTFQAESCQFHIKSCSAQ